ncbi:MAG: hypothetical protein JSV49_04305, partial [Thermoplasmata archaeon]
MAVEEPRLPLPRDDVQIWGAILNKFLRVSLNDDGTLKRVIGLDVQAWDANLDSIDQPLHTLASPSFAGSTITGNSVHGLNSAVFQPETDSETFLQVLDADGGVPVFNVDTINERVGIGTAEPLVELDIAGQLLITPTADKTYIVKADGETVPYTGSSTNYGIINTRHVDTPASDTGFDSYGAQNWLDQTHEVNGTPVAVTVRNYGLHNYLNSTATHSAETLVAFIENNHGIKNDVIRTGKLTCTKTTINSYGCKNIVQNGVEYDKSDGTITLNDYGTHSSVLSAVFETNGTLNRNCYGEYIIVSPGVTPGYEGNVTCYGLYIEDVFGGTVWAIYDDSGANSYFSGKVGIGVNDPDTKLEILNDGTQLKLSYDSTNYCTFATQSDGDLTIDSNKESYEIDLGDGKINTTGLGTFGGIVSTKNISMQRTAAQGYIYAWDTTIADY